MSVSLYQDAGGYGYADKLNCAIASLEPRPVRASPYHGPGEGKGSRTTPLTTTKPTGETTRFTGFHRAAMACVSLGMLLAASPALADETADAVAAMRAAVERFQDVEVALAEGYVRDPADHCFTAGMMGMPPEWGVMGIHYFRPDLLGVTATDPKVDGNGLHLDWDNPSILIYEPQAGGGLELVAVENLVFKAAWEAAGNSEPPRLLGRTWDHMVDNPDTADLDEAHGFAEHYDQHVWVFRDNPRGVLEPFNPAATCEHHTEQHTHN